MFMGIDDWSKLLYALLCRSYDVKILLHANISAGKQKTAINNQESLTMHITTSRINNELRTSAADAFLLLNTCTRYASL